MNASRLGIDSVNFGLNSDKLRNVLSESLLLTAAYRREHACSANRN